MDIEITSFHVFSTITPIIETRQVKLVTDTPLHSRHFLIQCSIWVECCTCPSVAHLWILIASAILGSALLGAPSRFHGLERQKINANKILYNSAEFHKCHLCPLFVLLKWQVGMRCARTNQIHSVFDKNIIYKNNQAQFL